MSKTQITSIDKRDDVFYVQTYSGLIFEADLVVHGAGRVPEIESLKLEQIAVDYKALPGIVFIIPERRGLHVLAWKKRI